MVFAEVRLDSIQEKAKQKGLIADIFYHKNESFSIFG